MYILYHPIVGLNDNLAVADAAPCRLWVEASSRVLLGKKIGDVVAEASASAAPRKTMGNGHVHQRHKHFAAAVTQGLCAPSGALRAMCGSGVVKRCGTLKTTATSGER